MINEDLALICEMVIQEQSAFATEKNLSVSLILSTTNTTVKMDALRISQVVRNILINAIKFAESNTKITITLAEDKEYLYCNTSNLGKGIPKNELNFVFDKFSQSSRTKTGAGGTGLGLSISKEIVDAHNGRIWAECDENGFTEFIFGLPKI